MTRLIVTLALVLTVAPVAAQVQMRPTDAPIVSAENESWYRLGEPIQFAGDVYYLAGPNVFFNGNTMVRTGHYNGVPLYADTTIEPYSVVFVPIGRGLMQPYERLRRGELAGTSGSRTPSFPVRLVPDRRVQPSAAVAPTAPPAPIGAINAFTQESTVVSPTSTQSVFDTAPAPSSRAPQPQQVVTLLRPENNDGLWVRYMGEKWISAGPAVPLREREFMLVGQYAGFPVFARPSRSMTIYLPTRAGLVAPYRLKE